MSAMASQFCSATDQRKIKTPRHWPLCGEFTGDRWIPITKDQLRVKCFHLMTSSWKDYVWVGLCCLKTGNKSEHNKTVSIFIGYTVLDVMFYLWKCQWGPNRFVSIPESDTLFIKYVTPQQFLLPFGRTDTLFTTHILLIIHQIFSLRCLQMLGKIEVKFTELCTPYSGINCPWLCFIAQIKEMKNCAQKYPQREGQRVREGGEEIGVFHLLLSRPIFKCHNNLVYGSHFHCS